MNKFLPLLCYSTSINYCIIKKGSFKVTLIHPKYREINVILTNGKIFKTKSTCNKDTLKLDIDVQKMITLIFI